MLFQVLSIKESYGLPLPRKNKNVTSDKIAQRTQILKICEEKLYSC